MTTAQAAATSIHGRMGLGAGLRRAVRRMSWRMVAGMLAITLAMDAWVMFDVTYNYADKPFLQTFASGAVINLSMGFCIMFATLVADELVRAGARRLHAYTCAVVIGSAAGALVQWAAHRGLELPVAFDLEALQAHNGVVQPAALFFEYLIWGSIIVFLYVNGRTALLATARMNAARLQRATVQRRALETKLQALQARVEPQFLFNTLARVRELYAGDRSQGSRMLGDLIGYLRAALPQLRDSTSTLEQELRLVAAYVDIVRTALRKPALLDIDAPPDVRAARMPPAVLLPLVNNALLASRHGETVRIAARAPRGGLRIELSAGAGSPSRDAGECVSQIRERLRAIYGERATLECESRSGATSRMVIEIPNESTDGGHR